jgi:formamidopyrimidine-DNA glycosylase
VPELPEVETMARDIRPTLAGATIRQARLYKSDVLRKVTKHRLEKALAGAKVKGVGRRAKHIVIELADDRRVIVQPRMTGSFGVRRSVRPSVRRSAAVLDHDPYVVLDLELTSGKTVFFRDVRRLGCIFLLTPKQWESYDAALGPEPLDKAFTEEKFAEIMSARAAVKKVIMDQKRLVGVGNIYANEALWMAEIDPSKPAHKVPAARRVTLRQAIIQVLRDSIKGRGTTIRDYRTGTGEPGNFAGRLVVYERAGEPCLRCGKRIALTHAIDGRATYFCPGCQR